MFCFCSVWPLLFDGLANAVRGASQNQDILDAAEQRAAMEVLASDGGGRTATERYRAMKLKLGYSGVGECGDGSVPQVCFSSDSRAVANSGRNHR